MTASLCYKSGKHGGIQVRIMFYYTKKIHEERKIIYGPAVRILLAGISSCPARVFVSNFHLCKVTKNIFIRDLRN